METSSEKPRTRELAHDKAILDATLAALERDGEAKLRVMDIAQAVGCSVGLLYHHYGDREGLIEAARIQQFKGLLDRDLRTIDAAVEACPSVDEFRRQVVSLSRLVTGPERLERRRQRVVVLGAAMQRPALREAIGRVQSEWTTAFQDTLKKAQAKGFLRPDLDARAVAVFVQAYTLGRVLSDIDPDAPIPDETWAELSLKFLLQLT
jgi:AcrR family transcriptional regulator